jgi:aryl-alcohol dehydrogenase-like predicted oxidoreductase
MRYFKLGNSDLKVSEIALGTMSLGKYHRTNAKIIHKACELGVNFFDTADLYDKGFNEKTVGRALQDRRDRVILATKVGNRWREDGSGWDWVAQKKYIKTAIFESLRRLRTSYIDLYQLHGGTLEDPIDEVIEAFEELKKAGHIRHYGISSIRPNVIREWVSRSNLSSVMMQYSLLDRRPEESCLNLLRENGVGLIVRGGLAKGLLAGKPPRSYLEHEEEAIREAQQQVAHHSREARSPAQTSLKFLTAQDAVTTVAVGASRVKQIQEAALASEAPDLESTELTSLRKAFPVRYYQKHR